MKTKWPALCLALALVFGLSGCGGGSDPAVSAVPFPSAAPSAQPTVDPQEVQARQETFDPRGTVLVDEGGLTITVDDLRQGDAGVELELELENTSQRELTVSAATASVNGYMTGVYFSCAVPAEGSAWGTATLFTDELAELGVTDLADVAVSFSIDGQAGSHTATALRAVTMPRAALYDYAASPFQQAMGDPDWTQAHGLQVLASATALLDQDGLALLSVYLVEDAFGTRQLRLEVENRGQERAVATLGDIALNGATLSPGAYGRYSIDPGKRYLATVSLEYLIPDGRQADYAALEEAAFSLNGAALSLSIPR